MFHPDARWCVTDLVDDLLRLQLLLEIGRTVDDRAPAPADSPFRREHHVMKDRRCAGDPA